MTNKFLINMQHGTAVAIVPAAAPAPADDILPGCVANITSILSTLIRAPSDERTGWRAEVFKLQVPSRIIMGVEPEPSPNWARTEPEPEPVWCWLWQSCCRLISQKLLNDERANFQKKKVQNFFKNLYSQFKDELQMHYMKTRREKLYTKLKYVCNQWKTSFLFIYLIL